MHIHAAIQLFLLASWSAALTLPPQRRQATAPLHNYEYRFDYVDNQGISPPEYQRSKTYTGSSIGGPDDQLPSEQSRGQSISVTYGVNIGLDKLFSIGGTVEYTTEVSKGTSRGAAPYCPSGEATVANIPFYCGINLTPGFHRKNGYSIRFDTVTDRIDGYVTWTVDIPRLDDDGFQFYEYEVCLCENEDGSYPEVNRTYLDMVGKRFPHCIDSCGNYHTSDPTGPIHLNDPPSGTRIMIVGDSITHGHDGDFTWRYRIWEWFRDSTDMNVNFVGPYSGTQPSADAEPPQPPRLDSDPPPDNSGPDTSGYYMAGIDPDFDRDHFAVWGRQYAQDVPLIEDQVATYQPDMLLVALGFNDMGWFVSDADGTLNSLRQFVKNARQANPNLAFAIANVPQRSLIGGREDLIDKTTRYNDLLPSVLRDLSTDESPIRLVDFAGNYDCQPSGCPSGYDGLHPNAMGEYQIAQAFSRTLHDDFEIGSGPLAIPANIPSRNVAVPANLRAAPEDMGVAVQWDEVPGVSSYGVRHRIVGQDAWETGSVPANRYDQTYTVEGIEWEFQVRSQYGDPEQGGADGSWSGSVRATAERNTPPPPNDIVSSPTADGLQVTWGSVNNSFNIDRFEVIIWDRDTPGAFIDTHAVRQSPFRVSGLNVGHRYDIWVSTWAGPGEGGLPASPPGVVVGGGQPGKPTNVQATNVDPTTVHITWDAVPGASSYRVFTNRDEFAGGQQDDTGTVVFDNEFGSAYLYPGTWHFSFCVSALNGNLASAQTCVTPPVAPGF